MRRCLSAALLLCPGPALADEALRAFNTDRPPRADTPYTVDAGHFQVETDAFDVTSTRVAGTTTTSIVAASPVIKWGLDSTTDVELQLAPLNFVRTAGKWHSGFGDLTARVKYNVVGDDGGPVAIALFPYVKAPTAGSTIGNGHWEGGTFVPLVVNLPSAWVLNVTTEFDALENAAGDGVHGNFSGLINVSHPVFTDTLTAYAEFWSDVSAERNVATQYSADFALTWLVRPNLQLDTGVEIGLTPGARSIEGYVGLSRGF